MKLETDKLYFGDCIGGMRKLPNGCCDLVCSDPPYGISYKTGYRSKEHKFSHEIANDSGEQWENLIKAYVKECYRVLKDNTAAYFFCSSKTIPFFMEQIEGAGFTIKRTKSR